MSGDRWVLYGATGYTGELIAEAAAKAGMRPVLAGRSAEKLARLAARYGFEHQAVALEDAAGLRRLLTGAKVVLHAAGPFVDTALPMVRACLDAQTSYLDITGELPVFEQTFGFDAAARARGIVLISGVGFDVVPTDCLARFVAEQTPGATSLEIALAPQGKMSAGTAKSAIGIMNQGGLVRRHGELVPVPFGKGAKRLRFTQRERWVVPGPLADLATAYRSTGIGEVTVYMAVSTRTANLLRRSWPLAMVTAPLARTLMRVPQVERAVRGLVEKRIQPATAEERDRGKTSLWAKATSPAGSTEAWMETPDGYAYTADIVLRCVQRVLDDQGGRLIGALAPATAFGTDFALEVPGTRRLTAAQLA